MSPTADRPIAAAATPDRRRRWPLPRVLGISATLVWALAVGAGVERVWRYEGTPGTAAPGRQTWPGSPLVTPQPGRATLVMFVHPRCPCSRASLAELREIVARAGERVTATVLFLRPQGAADVWERTATWSAAQDIPGVTVRVDRDGAEAERFGASTSGHTILYSSEGTLLFSGGITAARGHVGDNSGRQSVLALLSHKGAANRAHAVYGCSLHGRAARENGA